MEPTKGERIDCVDGGIVTFNACRFVVGRGDVGRGGVGEVGQGGV